MQFVPDFSSFLEVDWQGNHLQIALPIIACKLAIIRRSVRETNAMLATDNLWRKYMTRMQGFIWTKRSKTCEKDF